MSCVTGKTRFNIFFLVWLGMHIMLLGKHGKHCVNMISFGFIMWYTRIYSNFTGMARCACCQRIYVKYVEYNVLVILHYIILSGRQTHECHGYWVDLFLANVRWFWLCSKRRNWFGTRSCNSSLIKKWAKQKNRGIKCGVRRGTS